MMGYAKSTINHDRVNNRDFQKIITKVMVLILTNFIALLVSFISRQYFYERELSSLIIHSYHFIVFIVLHEMQIKKR